MSETPAFGAALARLAHHPQTVTLEGRPARRLATAGASSETILHALLEEIDTAMLAVRIVVACGADGPRLELQAATRRLRGFEETQAAATHLETFAKAAAAQDTPLAVLATPSQGAEQGAGLSVRALAEALDLAPDDPSIAPAERFLNRAGPVLRAAVVRRGTAQQALGAAADIPETEAGLAAILDGPWAAFTDGAEAAGGDTPLLTSWLSAEDPDPEDPQPAIAITHWPADGNNGTALLAILAFDPSDLSRLHGAFSKANSAKS